MIPAAVTGGDRAPGEGFLVLWLGGPGRWEPRVQALLDAAGVKVEDSGLDVLVDRANQRAPDLVVLTGAAASAPKGVVARLAEMHPARSVPVVAIGPAESAKPKPKSRYGLVASLDREAEPDALAKQLVQLLRGLSRRPAKWRIKAGRADIPTIAERFARNARSGLLAARGAGAIAFDQTTGVSPPPEVLVTALRQDVDHLTFHERPPGRIRILDTPPHEDQTAPPLVGARVLVIDGDPTRAGRVAARIEAAGGQARAIGLDKTAIGAAKALDPTLVVVGAHALSKEPCEPLWTEPRLVDASLLVLSETAFDASAALLLPTIADLCSVELAIARRLVEGGAVAERLETLGTARWLKVLGRVPHDVTFRVFSAAGRGRVDLSGGRVRGAAFRPSDSRMAMLEGRAAVDALLGLPFGRVLAGEPDALRQLEGVRGTRKTSVIGQVATPEEGVPRPIVEVSKKGLVAEEVFLHTPDRTTTPAERVLPSQPVRPPTTRPPAARTSDVPMQDLGDDDDFEMPTRNYTADAIAELQAELRSAAMVPEAVREERRRSSPLPPRPSPTPPRPSPAPPPRSDPPARASKSSEPAPIAPLPEPRTRPLPPEPAKPAAGSQSTWWFAAGAALAVGVAAYAAWQLSAEDPAPRAEAPPPRPPAPTPGPAVHPVAAPEAPAEPPPPEVAPDVEPVGVDLPPDPPEAEDAPAIEPGAIQLPTPDATAEGLIEEAIEAARRSAFPESEMHARQALAIDPHNPTAAYRLAVALYRQQRHDEALDWARRSAEWDEREPRARSLMGDLYMRTGRFETALTAYRAALEVEPNYGPATRGIERLRARGVAVD